MRRVCLKCGVEFDGRPDATLCAACAAASKAGSVVRERTCRACGTTFLGGPRAWFCPACRAERRRERDKSYHKKGYQRHLGDTDFCLICGNPYVVCSGLQKYCPECARDAVMAKDRDASKCWNRAHIDYDLQREQRHVAAAQIQCAVCGKPFVPGIGAPVTCSPECREAYRKKAAAEYEKSHRDERNAYRRGRRALKKEEQNDK